ncbi:Zinc finger protein [Porphyridium purpureum]|uniref:Zinc finger protein n=1 Tax=Porphyridium purpureum TaxID=35688 RepID=A0A5J4YUM6_PORPP|nr:Zinc finger protein [Porphyridium purpureum]|eukprot:POR0378..scf227_4
MPGTESRRKAEAQDTSTETTQEENSQAPLKTGVATRTPVDEAEPVHRNRQESTSHQTSNWAQARRGKVTARVPRGNTRSTPLRNSQRVSNADEQTVGTPAGGADDDSMRALEVVYDSEGNVRYKCLEPECGRLFTRRSNLKVHKRMHTEEEPYICTYPGCSKQYKWRSCLASHILAHEKQTGVVGSPKTSDGALASSSGAGIAVNAAAQLPHVAAFGQSGSTSVTARTLVMANPTGRDDTPPAAAPLGANEQPRHGNTGSLSSISPEFSPSRAPDDKSTVSPSTPAAPEPEIPSGASPRYAELITLSRIAPVILNTNVIYPSDPSERGDAPSAQLMEPRPNSQSERPFGSRALWRQRQDFPQVHAHAGVSELLQYSLAASHAQGASDDHDQSARSAMPPFALPLSEKRRSSSVQHDSDGLHAECDPEQKEVSVPKRVREDVSRTDDGHAP